jgi:EF-P beta-lysylation protein EpmB
MALFGTKNDSNRCQQWSNDTSSRQSSPADLVTDPQELCRLLRLPRRVAEAASAAAEAFPLRIPRALVERIEPGNPADPLLRQVLPVSEELVAVAGFEVDPLGETQACGPPGLLWKYPSRALLLTGGACAVNCRFCFRRHYPFAAGPRRPEEFEPALAEIAAQPTLEEIILSGGDPLGMPPAHLAVLLDRLAAIPHVRRIRIHTRLPVAMPERVDDGLVKLVQFAICNLQFAICNESNVPLNRQIPILLLVLHVNHPAEIDADVASAIARLRMAGIPLLSQGVLLRGVNDCVETLVALYQRLVDLGVMPYYLHQLDPVAGAAHFEVPVARGIELISQLRLRLPGYAVPRYVRETRGGAAKELLA